MGAIDADIIKKGKKLAGRMGGEQVTVQNLEVVKIDLEKNVMLIRGNVPGAKNSFVMVTNAVKKTSAAINPEALA
jgi:large subunit ribosomal protein L3